MIDCYWYALRKFIRVVQNIRFAFVHRQSTLYVHTDEITGPVLILFHIVQRSNYDLTIHVFCLWRRSQS